jgi:hypothetical protein
MKPKERQRRYHERWVDCAAADAAYERIRTQQGEFKKLTELGRGLLSRIRGRGERGGTRVTTLMHFESVKQFAERCGVAVDSLLANGDGWQPLQLNTSTASVAGGLDEESRPSGEIASVTLTGAEGSKAPLSGRFIPLRFRNLMATRDVILKDAILSQLPDPEAIRLMSGLNDVFAKADREFWGEFFPSLFGADAIRTIQIIQKALDDV